MTPVTKTIGPRNEESTIETILDDTRQLLEARRAEHLAIVERLTGVLGRLDSTADAVPAPVHQNAPAGRQRAQAADTGAGSLVVMSGKRSWTPEARKRQSRIMKKRWAAERATERRQTAHR